MTPEQWKLHPENKELVASIVQKWRRYKFLSESDRRKLMIGLQNMRMSCDSTYLLDQSNRSRREIDRSDHPARRNPRTAGTKVVVFSQWLRMHELLEQRVKKKGWGHVMFHGGVPSSKRKDLVDRFRDDPNCRLFLSTDAGGVGLNLQFASVVMNMDLPWNPAVLEQRIGRVHRLGQKQPVRVREFRRPGDDRRRHAFGDQLQEVALRRRPRRRRAEHRFRRQQAEEVHGVGRIGDLAHPRTAGLQRSRRRHQRIQRQPFRIEAAGRRQKLSRNEPRLADPWSGLLQTGMALLQQMAAPRNGERASDRQKRSLNATRKREKASCACRFPIRRSWIRRCRPWASYWRGCGGSFSTGGLWWYNLEEDEIPYVSPSGRDIDDYLRS